jgi:DNA-directed RNA polymerase subunit RPC12/RpoP
MPKRWCIGCGDLFDLDTTGTLRCPACQAIATAKRQARPNTTRRGYGTPHQKLRARLLAAFQPGQPCARCGKPIRTKADAQLGHIDADRSRYRGLEHVRCNEATSGR